MNLGVVCQKLSNLEKAKEFYELAIDIWDKNYEKGHIHTANPLMNLGNIYRNLGNL